MIIRYDRSPIKSLRESNFINSLLVTPGRHLCTRKRQLTRSGGGRSSTHGGTTWEIDRESRTEDGMYCTDSFSKWGKRGRDTSLWGRSASSVPKSSAVLTDGEFF